MGYRENMVLFSVAKMSFRTGDLVALNTGDWCSVM